MKTSYLGIETLVKGFDFVHAFTDDDFIAFLFNSFTVSSSNVSNDGCHLATFLCQCRLKGQIADI